MERGQIVTRIACVVLILGATGAGTRLQASDQSGGRADRTEVRAIEGVWLPFVTITDCDTKAEIASFPSMEMYIRGGGYVGFGAVHQADQIGLGAWRYNGHGEYVAEYQFVNYTPFGAPDGTPDGTLLKVSATVRLNAAGTAFTSSTKARVVDSAGNVLGETCGHREATRLQ